MKKMKNESGVTLIILVITVIVLIILTSVSINNARYQIGLKEVNNLYSDIDILSSKVTDYYMKNNTLPIVEDKEYFNNRNDLMVFLVNNNLNTNGVNKNDNGKYYVIDLSKLENLTLNYGKDYYKWTSSSVASNSNSDIYIINTTTHQIYYPKGIRRATEYVITNTINRNSLNIEEIENSIKNAENTITSNLTCDIININRKIISQNENAINVLMDTKIRINNIDPDYKKETLEFLYSFEDEESNIENGKFIKFLINDSNVANLVGTLNFKNKNSNSVYLWVRLQDVNGNIKVEKIAVNYWTMTADKVHVTNGIITLEVGSHVTGYSVTVGSTTYGNDKWYVLGAENGKLLITTNENVSSITLSGKNGYTGGISTLNTEAAKYTNSNYAEGQARSINVDDINRVTGYDPNVAQYNSGNNVNQWGNEVIYTKNESSISYIGTKYPTTSTTTTAYSTFTYWTGAEWKTLDTGESSQVIKHTYYNYYPQTLTTTSSTATSVNGSSSAYNLLFSNTSSNEAGYWLGSNYVDLHQGFITVGMRSMFEGCVRGSTTYLSYR